ncbi:methylated-DNA--[protein]-cysteine S-methyltransferase [Aquamicrobium ahrensii]|uniref:Methylated-DNA-[protein]-cysteine S-methyltransferase n=1 Tax=Aquamicrobium ahrensii TaxID=469551 RepID=A0ABV2KJD2_9HYPH
MRNNSTDTPVDAMPSGHAVFQTDMGFAGLAWSASGITRLCLPEKSRSSIERRLAGDGPCVEQPQGWVAELIGDIRAYFTGAEVDFSAVPVDLGGVDAFRRDIYAAARRLAFGEAVTYGELARRAGHEGMARETGAALGANPAPLVVPCHRIVAAGGKIGGFSAPGGSATKLKMLKLEGVRVRPPPPAQTSFGF